MLEMFVCLVFCVSLIITIIKAELLEEGGESFLVLGFIWLIIITIYTGISFLAVASDSNTPPEDKQTSEISFEEQFPPLIGGN